MLILFNILLKDVFFSSTVVEREEIMMGRWINGWIQTQVTCMSTMAQCIKTKTQNQRTGFHLICEREFELN